MWTFRATVPPRARQQEVIHRPVTQALRVVAGQLERNSTQEANAENKFTDALNRWIEHEQKKRRGR